MHPSLGSVSFLRLHPHASLPLLHAGDTLQLTDTVVTVLFLQISLAGI